MSLITKLFGRVIQIRIRGAINLKLTKSIYQGLHQATYLPTKAAFINISSHHGSLTQAKNICDIIKNFRQQKKVKVYCFAEDQCLGVGNLLASCADYSYASRMSLLGGFGFTWANVGFNKWQKKYGVKQQMFSVNELQPRFRFFEPLSDQVQKFTKNQVEMLSCELKNQFLANRKEKILNIFKQKEKEDEIMRNIEREILSKPVVEAEEMLRYGLIDGIKNSWDVLDGQFPNATLYKIGKPNRLELLKNATQNYQGELVRELSQNIKESMRKQD